MGLGGDRNHGGADMAQAKTWAAFDVHVSGVVAATLDRESGELRVQRLPGRSEDVGAFAAELPGPVRATYASLHHTPDRPGAHLALASAIRRCLRSRPSAAAGLVGRQDGERHHPLARRGEAAGAVAGRGPGEVQVRGAPSAAGARGAVAGVAVVADELDRGGEAAGGARAWAGG